MDVREEKSNDDLNIQIRQTLDKFLEKITEFEQVVADGSKFLSGFQHGLELLQQHPMNPTSESITSIVEENENKRLRSYIEAGWAKTHYKVSHMCEMNTCFEGLQDLLTKAKQIMCELELLMDNAIQILPKSPSELCDANEYASFMAVIYGMVKLDYVMQERIVSSLNLATSTEELDSYCLMWSLRPFVDDAVINQAFKYID